MSWVVIHPSGEYKVMDGIPSYDDLRGVVGGWLEHISFPAPDRSMVLGMYLDEEGKLKGLAVNPLATFLAEDVLGYADFISGTAVVVGQTDHNGEETSIPAAVLPVLTKILDQQRPLMHKLHPTKGPFIR